MDLSNIQIQTERLLLVPVAMEFKELMFHEFQEPITLFMYPKPAVRIEETEDFIKSATLEQITGTDLTMAITKSGEFLGCAGLHNLNTEIPELGIWIKQSAHGNKYGQEAIAGLKKWADENISYKYITYPVVEQNIASRKIAESLGGKIMKEYEKETLSGRTYHMLEYWIGPEVTMNVEDT